MTAVTPGAERASLTHRTGVYTIEVVENREDDTTTFAFYADPAGTATSDTPVYSWTGKLPDAVGTPPPPPTDVE